MNPALTLMLLAMGQQPLPAMTSGCQDCGPSYAPGMMPPMMGPRPALQACAPLGPPAPLLAMKALLPEGVLINAMPGDPAARTYASGTTFGFRPGYYYPLQISNLPGDLSQMEFYPVLEVRGTLQPRASIKYMEYAAPLALTLDDLRKVADGKLITKVIYLENPDRAIPVEAKADEPIEVSANTSLDAIDEAQDNGRIVAILRIGDRKPDAEDLARMTIPGTILLPGENRLVSPIVPPCIGVSAVPLYDPILGPKLSQEECFPNGGDGNNPLGLNAAGRVGGLDPTDVVAEYTQGTKRKVTSTNIVCICTPRFVIRKAELGATGFIGTQSPSGIEQQVGQSVFLKKEYLEAVVGRQKTLGLDSRVRPSAAVALTMLHILGSLQQPVVVGSAQGLRLTGTYVNVEELSNFPTDLVVTKSVEPKDMVQQGDTITITIRYYNNTRTPVTDLIISDSLSGRLEYVPGSAAADRPSNVTTTENEAGSAIVKFEIPGPIPPASKGVVVFQAKIR